MDLKIIPQIKIDLHDEVLEVQKEGIPHKPRHRALSSPELVDCDGDLQKLRRRIKIKKTGSLDADYILHESQDGKPDLDAKMEAPGSAVGPTRKEKKITKPRSMESISQEKGIPKRNSLPAIAVNGRGNGCVDALVSPMMLRKFDTPKRVSRNVIPQKGKTGGIESTIKSRPTSPRLPKIKSSWTAHDDKDETMKDKTYPFQASDSPYFPRKDLLGILDAMKPRKDESEFDIISRPRSSSLTLSLDESSHQPSMHWRIARGHIGSKHKSSPSVAQLLRNTANAGQMIGNRTIQNFQLDTDKNRSRTNHSKTKNKNIFLHEDSSGDTLNRNNKQTVSLEKRLEAIEIKHGIMHENSELTQIMK